MAREGGLDGLRLALRGEVASRPVALGAQDAGLPLGLGSQDGRLLLALGAKDLRGLLPFRRLDRRFALPLGSQDDRALVPVGTHLLLHRVLDGRRRVDRLDLDTGYADAPRTGRLVEHAAQLGVDLVATGQCLLEVQRADDVTKGRDRQLLDGLDVVLDLVGGRAGIGDLEVDDRVDGDGQVVRGDHRLRREADDLLAQVDERAHPVDEGQQQGQPGRRGADVAPKPFDDGGTGLRHDTHHPGQCDETGRRSR